MYSSEFVEALLDAIMNLKNTGAIEFSEYELYYETEQRFDLNEIRNWCESNQRHSKLNRSKFAI